MHAPEIRHGHGHDPLSRPLVEIDGSFAYHLRRYRQRYGDHGISQRALAMVAHVSRHFIENLERGTDMQVSVEALLRVAIALRHRVEDLVSPDRIASLRDEIERRRRMLDGDAALPGPAPASARPAYTLAVAYRSPHLIMALSDGNTVLEIRQYRSVRTFFRARSLIEREARAYDVKEILVEEDTKTADEVRSLGVPFKTLTFRRAKQHVLGTGDAEPPANKGFFRALVARHPELERYVRVMPATGNVAMTERWRTARLTVATLALAAPAAAVPRPPRWVVGDPSGSLKHRRQRRGSPSPASSL